MISHYEPLNISPFAKLKGFDRECPNAQEVSQKLFRIPIFESIEYEQMLRINEFLESFS